MIAFAETSTAETGFGTQQTVPSANGRPAWHDRYLAILPKILRQARRWASSLPVRFREEAIEEVVARTVVAYARLADLHKEQLAYPTALTRYAMMQYRSGRRVGQAATTRDVLSP